MHNARGIFESKSPDVIFPKIESSYWSEDKKILIIPVKLEKGKNYAFRLPSYVFQAEDKFPMQEDVEITFRTEE